MQHGEAPARWPKFYVCVSKSAMCLHAIGRGQMYAAESELATESIQ